MTATITTLPVIYGRNQNIVRTSSATIIIPDFSPPTHRAMEIMGPGWEAERARRNAEAIARGCPSDDPLTDADSLLANRKGDA